MKTIACDGCGKTVRPNESRGALRLGETAESDLCGTCWRTLAELLESGALKDQNFHALYGPASRTKKT